MMGGYMCAFFLSNDEGLKKPLPSLGEDTKVRNADSISRVEEALKII